MDLLINVGLGKYDNKNHIYKLDDDKRKGKAPTHYGVSEPVGDRIKSAPPTDSIPQNQDLSTDKSEIAEKCSKIHRTRSLCAVLYYNEKKRDDLSVIAKQARLGNITRSSLSNKYITF